MTVDAATALTPEGFDLAQRELLESEIQIYPTRSWHPSSIGHPCDRLLVWRWTKSDKARRHSPTLQSIFNEGRDVHQPSIYRRLEKMGYEIVRESDRPVHYKLGKAVISGKPDGRILGFRGERFRPTPILEAKSLSDYAWNRLHVARDLLEAKSPWTRAYYAQGHIYALLENTPLIVFVLKNKQTGLLKVLVDELDYAYAEEMLAKVERLHPMVEAEADPPPIEFDWRVCGGCGFLNQCFPAKRFGEGASVIDDPEFVELLERREALRPHSREFDHIDDAVKARLKHEGISLAVAGPFTIEGAERKRRAYEVKESSFVVYTIIRAGEAPAGEPLH